MRLTVECFGDPFQTDMKFEEKIEEKNLHATLLKDARYLID